MPKSRRSSRVKPGAVPSPARLPTESEPEAGRSSRKKHAPGSDQGLGSVLCAAVLLLTGAVLRLLYLDEIPAGLNQDEASVGYEAWSLLHYGITRNGYAWPVNFVAWGTGQSALYSYLSIPLIAAFDLTVVSTRLLMALTGTASLLLFWQIAVRDQPTHWPCPPSVPWSEPGACIPAHAGIQGRGGAPGACFALLALLLLTFCPWHLMLSRLALDCNLLPFVILFAVYFFTRPDNDRLGIQAAGVFVLSLSVYAYTAAYFFAPVFLALVFGWLRVQGKLPLRHFLLLSTLSLLTVLPILLFLAVNFFDWEAIRAGISMPKYTGQARYETLSTVFGGRFLASLVDQLLFVVKLLTTSDPVPTEYFSKLPHFAVLFPFAIVPLAVGFGMTLYRAVTRRECGVPLLMALWLIAAFATVSITLVNIYRANVVWLPAVYFTALGVFYACCRWRAVLTLAAVAYLSYGGWFVQTYFTHYNDRDVPGYHSAFLDLQPAIASVVEHASSSDKIYITRFVNEPYMQVLFHTKTPPRDYLNTRNIRFIADPNGPFTFVNSFGRFIFTSERISEANRLILRAHPDQLHRIVLHGEEVAALDSATLAKCAGERHGRFHVLHCD